MIERRITASGLRILPTVPTITPPPGSARTYRRRRELTTQSPWLLGWRLNEVSASTARAPPICRSQIGNRCHPVPRDHHIEPGSRSCLTLLEPDKPDLHDNPAAWDR